jgi:C1A family cysteine protease
MDDAFAYLSQNGGLESYDSYSYVGRDQSCKFQESLSVVNITGYKDLDKNETEIAAVLASVGPLSAAVNAGGIEWQFYVGGVLEPWICNPQSLDHGITIVGYGTEKTFLGQEKEVWIIKNSWGETWGVKGYVYLLRNSNECGISECVSTSTL